MDISTLKDIVDIATGVVTIVVLLLGGTAGIFVFYRLAPTLSLNLTPSWVGDSKEYLSLKCEIENKSRVRVHRPRIRIQVLEQRIGEKGHISQWVPFSQTAIKADEQPVEWRDPEEIATTTERIYPAERIIVERLYHFPQPSIILHIALQVRVRLGLWGRIVTLKGQDWSQTVTKFVVK